MNNLKKLMVRDKVLVKTLSWDLGVSFTTAANWRQGKTLPRTKAKRQEVANYFNVDVKQIWSDGIIIKRRKYKTKSMKYRARMYNAIVQICEAGKKDEQSTVELDNSNKLYEVSAHDYNYLKSIRKILEKIDR